MIYKAPKSQKESVTNKGTTQQCHVI